MGDSVSQLRPRAARWHRGGHEQIVEDLLDQMVCRERPSMLMQKRLVRILERVFVGDARRTGQLHQWMYDEFTLRATLQRTGFRGISRYDAFSSAISGWTQFGLDLNLDGVERKPGSLYIEATR